MSSKSLSFFIMSISKLIAFKNDKIRKKIFYYLRQKNNYTDLS